MGLLHPVEYSEQCNAVVILVSTLETLMMQVHCQARSRRASVELGGALTLFTSHLQQKLERKQYSHQSTSWPSHGKLLDSRTPSLIIGGIR